MAIGKQPDVADDVGDEGTDSIFAEINITPLTDVFLVMVIIFMVSALAVQVERQEEKKQEQKKAETEEVAQRSGIKINLPSGQAQEIDPSKASLVLEIPISGDIVIGGKAMPDATVDNVFRAAFARDKNTQVVLKADKGVAHGRVVNLMERAKQVGLTRLAIGTAGG
ncbi:MAG: biopolymer transporter ExbD [Deltaproteobacteria bacterium]|nr:biopolymer transporter ExbD [Deltaproteobacteria bacterium]MDQ3296631.1 biopolymer transporter ExbD [Myxococcota bacterium]